MISLLSRWLGRAAMALLAVWVGLLIGSASVRAQDPAAAQAELKAQQGVWQVLAFVRDGKPTDPETVASITRTVEGDRAVWFREGQSFAGTRLELDPTRKPHAIDVIPEGGRNQGERVLGIYRLEGETLTLCMADPGGPRPTEFTAEPGSRRTLMTFRRVPRTPAADR